MQNSMIEPCRAEELIHRPSEDTTKNSKVIDMPSFMGLWQGSVYQYI